jgi:UDP-N-acetylmuramate--alanine ligase
MVTDAARQHDSPAAHLIGIAGSGMQSLAAVLLGRGWRVSGSDRNPRAAAHLRSLGAEVFADHDSTHVPHDARLVVYSEAIPPDNVERRRAAELAIDLRSYPQALGRLSRASCSLSLWERAGVRAAILTNVASAPPRAEQFAHPALLAVAGTHGKSTVTAMTAAALVRAGLDPTVVCGATPIGCRTGGRAGEGSVFLAEACEYRANFLHLRPHVAAVLNVEPDHFDYFTSPRHLLDTFRRFVHAVPDDGLVLVNHDCRAARELAIGLRCRTITFGMRSGADWTARHVQSRRGRYRFWLVEQGRPKAEVQLQIAGRHQIGNALAAAALASAAGADPDAIAAALSGFRGLKRRLEIRRTAAGITLIDDYAHHPTEVRATLAAVRKMYPGRRLWCVFQPHQASRTAALFDEFAASLLAADRIAIADVFRAREGAPQAGDVTAADLARAVAVAGSAVLNEHRMKSIAARVESELRAGDVLVTMGAGDIGKIGQAIDQRLRKDRARS